MAVNRVPVLKRCRSLGMDPIYLGISKKSVFSFVRNRKQNSSMAFLRNRSETISRKQNRWKV